MSATEAHSATCRYPDLPRDKCGCFGPNLAALPDDGREGLRAALEDIADGDHTAERSRAIARAALKKP